MSSDLIRQAETERESVLRETLALSADLPLKYLRQQAHYTTPASNDALAEKAVSRGFAPVEKIFARHQIAPEDLAETLEVPIFAVEDLLHSQDRRAPLVVIDGEDSQALDEEVTLRGRENAVRIFREGQWGPGTLRFYRPNSLRLPSCVPDLVTVLTQAGAGLPPEAYPLDGIVFPKVEQPGEIDWLCEVLSAIEAQLGLAPNRIRMQILVESGWAVAHLAEIARCSISRLAGLIFGSADYAADLTLPAIRNDHPLCDWARAQVVNVAGAAGVPAIDAMTLNYPVADPALSAAENRERILARLKECYTDALHGIDMGMQGKWVGHPAQLFVVLLAYRTRLSPGAIQSEVERVRAYQAAVQEKVGVTIINGVMSDRATDRHTRTLLRQAVALGLLPLEEGLALGVVTAEEVAGLDAHGGSHGPDWHP